MTSQRIQVLLGPQGADLGEILKRIRVLPPLRPFDPRLVEFVARLSKELLFAPNIRDYPELAALGHWFRKARLLELARRHVVDQPDLVRLGRGMAFHVAPANVDSVFMYSWLLSLLAGNTNVVRVSQEATPQQELLVDLLQQLCADQAFADVAPRIVLLTYPHDRELTQQLSQACAVRLVWGGDATVNEIRSIPLRPTATELCFPDRFSLSAIRASALLEIDDEALRGVAHGFYNDAFWFGQQACSSPRMVVWVGSDEDVRRARGRFWPAVVDEISRHDPENSPAMLMARLGASFECAASGSVDVLPSTDLAAYPLVLDVVGPDLHAVRETHCGNGLFYQQSMPSLADLASSLTDKDQTLAVFGFGSEEIEDFIAHLPTRAIDRIAAIGKALDFAAVWDGQDFFSSLTRCITVVS